MYICNLNVLCISRFKIKHEWHLLQVEIYGISEYFFFLGNIYKNRKKPYRPSFI